MAAILLLESKTTISTVSISTNETTDEDYGCASDCVRASRTIIQFASDVLDEDPNDHIDDYLNLYHSCYAQNCG
ncbi:hypothetical protein [Winogradskyella wichelsiae]|uniref:hypothetical protein n=1 Tax=Winogradskyella wichelsiae TaxID=2697007 RepID=UPI0015C8C92B|nr:hypothetical protein [Winogradskyella wichelsiae]